MYICLQCSCEAHLEIDVVAGDEAAGWVMVHRFSNAHAEHCNFVTPLPEQSITNS